MACKETKEFKTQKDMAKASGVTEVTIRNRVRDLATNLSYIQYKVQLKNELVILLFHKIEIL